MSVFSCFTAKIEKGIVDRALGQTLLDSIAEAETELGKRMSRHDAALQAAIEKADEISLFAEREARRAVLQIEKQLDVLKTVQRAEEALNQRRDEGKAPMWLKDPRKSSLYSAMRALLTRDGAELVPGTPSVYYLARNLRGRAHAMFTDGIEALRPTMAGFRQQTALELEVLQAIKDKGASVSDRARAIAKSWTDTAEMLRQEFERAGGELPLRQDWGLPNPVHDTLKIRSTPGGRDAWIAFVKPLLDRNAMLSFDTGQPIGPSKLNRLLEEMYESVATGGRADGPSSAFSGAGALAKRRNEQRFLVFKDAESWAAYDERFGAGKGVYETMMGHIENMAEDIAMLQVLGPNPEATKRFMLSLFDREAARMTRQAEPGAADASKAQAYKDNVKIASGIAKGKRAFENLWAEVTGANKVPVDIEQAHFWGEARSGLVASQMGSAILSSITDPALMSMIARFNDIPAANVIKRAIAGMADGSFELNAAQLGLVADSAAMRIRANDQFMGETMRTGIMAKIASGVIQLSGLRRWTGVLRASFGMEMMATAANRLAMPHADLPQGFRDMLGRYGIGAPEWALIQGATPNEPRPGGKFLTAADIRALDTPEARSIADRWQRAIDEEMDYAVIEGDPETRALMYGQSQPGTAEGELRRAIGQYKGFPITFALLHFGRAMAQGNDSSRLTHAALTFAALWGMGMVAMQAKEIAKGRDPITMDPTTPIGIRAWGAAALQGGGFGIFGDFLFMDQTRQGASLASTLAGPSFAAVEKVFGDFLMANVQRAWKGQETHFAGDALYAGAGFLPGSNLWYLRTAFQRGVLDQLALMIDERTPQRFERIEREAQKNWGQSFWWEPGRVEPRRSPAISAAFGGGP